MDRFGLKEGVIDDMYNTFKNVYLKLMEFINTDNESEKDRAAIIHAFEYTFELWWKCLQKYIETIGTMEQYGPSSTIKTAVQYKILQDEYEWMNMLRDRNLTSHTYKEDVAKDIYIRIKDDHILLLQKFINKFDGIIG